MKNILVFGANGMLGSYISSFLGKKHNVVKITRKELDIYMDITKGCIEAKLNNLITNIDYVINCACITNKREDCTEELYIVNSFFPYLLSLICKDKNIKMIHASTDGVFSGSKGNYNKDDKPTCNSSYGISKCLADQIEACIIRSSIIGESKNKKDFLEWVMSKNTINGYTNHYWNGMTCLEYAKFIDEMIEKDTYWIGVKHIGSKYKNNNYISKCDLAKEIISVYNLNTKVIPYECENKCDRSLKLDVVIDKDIIDQIKEQKEY